MCYPELWFPSSGRSVLRSQPRGALRLSPILGEQGDIEVTAEGLRDGVERGEAEVGAVDGAVDGWPDHPDYMTCGHIHKRQHLWNTSWARYTGSVLPMSVAEADYTHGVDVITIEGSEAGGRSIRTNLREYVPQHRLLVLPNDDEGLSPKKLKT